MVGKWEYKTPELYEENGKDASSSDSEEEDIFLRRRSARLKQKRCVKRCRQASFCGAEPKRGLFD